jgi:hypothetical protein
LTVTVWFATVNVPVRAAPAFAATVNVTVPFAMPLDPDAIEIHTTLLTAVHGQPGEAVTETDVPAEPVEGTDTLDGLTE